MLTFPQKEREREREREREGDREGERERERERARERGRERERMNNLYDWHDHMYSKCQQEEVIDGISEILARCTHLPTDS